MTYKPRVVLDELGARDFKPSGLSGSTVASRYVGATTSGAPTSGTFAVGDFVLDQAGKVWICTGAGTPGAWGQAGNMHYRGAWSSGTTYAPNDVVTYGGATFVAGTTGSNNTPGPVGNAFTGMGSNSSMPFVIATGTVLAQTIGGFWLKINALPVARTALLEFSHPTSPATNYYRLVCGVNGHVYVEAQVLSQAAISLDISVNALVPGTWYWVGFGSACPASAITYQGGVETLGGGSNSFTQGLTQNAGVATQSVTWVFSVGTCPSAPSLANLPSAWYMADIRVNTGNSSVAPFVRTDPVDTPSQGSPVASYAAPAGTGTVGQLTDGVGTRNIAGSFSVVADNPVPSTQWTVLPASLPGTASFTGEAAASDFKAVGLIGATASSRYVGATASGAPASGTFAVGDFVIDQTAKIWVCTVAGTPGTWVQLSGGGSSTLAGDTDVSISSPVGGQVLGYSAALAKWVNQNVAGVAATTSTAVLGSSVALTTAGTYYDGPSLTVAAGTWLLVANLTVQDSASGGSTTLDAKLWDGTTILDSAEATSGIGFRQSIALSAIVSPTTTTTYKASVRADQASATLLAAGLTDTGATNATKLTAIQLSGNPVGQTAPAVRVHNSTGQSIPNATVTTLTFDTTDYDQGTSTPQHSTSTNTSRLTCQQSGIYLITANVGFVFNATGGRESFIVLNGITNLTRQVLPATSGISAASHLDTSLQYHLNVGDYVELQVFQNSGGALAIDAVAQESPYLTMARIDSGPGAVQPNTKVQLDYALASDIGPITSTSGSWVDFISNQNFIIDDSNSVIEVEVSGQIDMGGSSAAQDRLGARIIVDSAGSSVTKMLSGSRTDSNGRGNPLSGAGTTTITGLSAGTHTVKLQVAGSGTDQFFCRPVTNTFSESLQIRVLERKQSTSPPSSTPAPAVRCYNSTAISVPTATATALALNTTRFDQGTSTAQHSTSTNTSRLVCQQAGIYQISGNIEWAANGTGVRDIRIVLNGSTIIGIDRKTGVTGNTLQQSVSTEYQLSTGDYVELVAYQESGGALNVDASSNFSPEFMMARMDTGGTGAVYVPVVKTANYTILPTDSMVVAGASGLTLTLPAASAYTGKPPLVIKNDGFTTTTIARSGSDVIDGATSYALVAAYSSVSLVSDSNATWRVI